MFPGVKRKNRSYGLWAAAVFLGLLVFFGMNNRTAYADSSNNAIQFSGNQYIDTGIPAGTNGLKIVIDYELTQTTMQWVFGAGIDFGINSQALSISASGQYQIWHGNTLNNLVAPLPDLTRHTLAMDNATTSIDGAVVNVSTGSLPTANVGLYVGSFDVSGRPATPMLSAKVYSVEVYSGATLLRDFIPIASCQTMDAETASAVGFYDTVTGAIFYNQGASGSLTYSGDDDGECAVSFANDDDAAPTELIDYGDEAIEPATPTRAGFQFAGWYSDDGLTTLYDFQTPVTFDETLYAGWNAVCASNPAIAANSNACSVSSVSGLSGRVGNVRGGIVPGAPNTGFRDSL